MEHGTLPVMANLPRRGPLPIHRVAWPDYGYDEWFRLAALYPRMVPRGTLTFLPADAQSLLLPVDIEYVTWANRRSEIVYFWLFILDCFQKRTAAAHSLLRTGRLML